MNHRIIASLLRDALAIIIGTVLATLCVVQPQLTGSSWLLRLGLLGLSVALAGGAAGWLILRTLRQQAAAARCVEDFCDLEVEIGAEDELPGSLDQRDPWYRILKRVHDCLLAYRGRLAEAEHARARLEIRAHRLSTQHQQMSEIVTGLAEPVVAVDHYDELVFVNPSAQQLFEIDEESTEKQTLGRLMQCEALVELLSDTRRRRAPAQRTGEIELLDDQGQKHWYRATVRSIPTGGQADKGSGSSTHGAVAILHDVSGEKAIQRRNAEFVSSVSHEMKTPLAGIKAYVELLVDGDAEDDETQEEFLSVINGQADRLQRLIDNMLNLARIEAGVVNVNKKPQSLNDLLEEAYSIVQPSAEQKQIELIRDLSPMYLEVLVDRDMILQSAINLLSNAIKYTPEGGQVTLRSRVDDQGVQYEVQDTGVGLSEEDCKMVFEKFYRVNKDRQMAPGTGLGLPLAKHIVQDVHGGCLTLQSKPDKGSTFRVTLPKVGG